MKASNREDVCDGDVVEADGTLYRRGRRREASRTPARPRTPSMG